VKIYRISQSEAPSVNNPVEIKLPTLSEIVSVLKNHPLIGNVGRVRNAYLIGSFASGKQNPSSDVDILLEIYPVKSTSSEEFTELKRRKIQEYFMKNNLRGQADSVHPQWNGRRVDLYFTYDASTDNRPKIQLAR